MLRRLVTCYSVVKMRFRFKYCELNLESLCTQRTGVVQSVTLLICRIDWTPDGFPLPYHHVQSGYVGYETYWSLVVRGYFRGLKRQDREAAHSPQSNAEVKSTQSCTSPPCIRLRDIVSVKESLHAAYSCPFKKWHPWTLWRMTLIYILGLYKSKFSL